MRDILVFSESFKHWGPAIEYAARLAGACDARLTGICFCASPLSVAPSFETPELLSEILEATMELEREAAAAGPAFSSHAAKFAAHLAAWQVAEGYVPDALALAGNWHDLLVIERTERAMWGSLSAVGNIVLSAGLPCLAIPGEASSHVPALDVVAIAWNGSSEALRAAHAALPLLQRARRIVILSGEQRPPASMAAWQPPFDLEGYLLRHGLRADHMVIQGGTEDDVGAALLRAATEVGAGLLVMGVYGHTRFREWVLGGVTRYVLTHAGLPLLLRH